MAAPALKLNVVTQAPGVMVESKMSSDEAKMYSMVREYRCTMNKGPGCPARLIIGKAGVVLDCPNCGSVGQTYPQ